MSDSYVSNSYNAETDGKMSQETVTYTNKDGNTVYTVANYKELETKALKIQEDLIKNNPLGITTAMMELDIANREKELAYFVPLWTAIVTGLLNTIGRLRSFEGGEAINKYNKQQLLIKKNVNHHQFITKWLIQTLMLWEIRTQKVQLLLTSL